MEKRARPEAEEGNDDPSGKRARDAPLPTFKLLVPKSLASTIQFSISAIEGASGVTLSVTDREDCYPGTDHQVVHIQGETWDGILAALQHVLSMVANCSDCIAPGHEEERRVSVVMPSKAVSALIGVRGANVKELQTRTGCHIHVDGIAIGFGPGGDRAVNINGPANSLEKAMSRCVGCVQEFSDQVWFARWASRTNSERLEQDQAPPLRGHEMGKGEEMGGKGHYGKGGYGKGEYGKGEYDAYENIPMGCCIPGGMKGMGKMAGMMGGGMSSGGMCGGMLGGMSAMMGGCIPGGMMGGGMGAMGGGMPMGAMGGPGMAAGMGMGPGMGNGMGHGMMFSGMGAGGKDNFSMGRELVMNVMDDMPPFVSQDPRGFVLRSAVPTQMVGLLQKRAMQVMGFTGTKISFNGEAGATARIMSVEGQLFNVCASYMLMMRRYLEVESELC